MIRQIAIAKNMKIRLPVMAAAYCLLAAAVAAGGEDLEVQVAHEIDVRAASFKQITPGETRIDRAREILGEPDEVVRRDGKNLWIYRAGTLFSQVDVVFDSDLVASVVLHLQQPTPPNAIRKELDLAKFPAAIVPNEAGPPLGLAFPERGVLLGYAPQSKSLLVEQIILEPISAELFVHRAKFDAEHRFAQNVQDLSIAIELDPKYAEAYWMRARIRHAIGDFETALEDAEIAVRLDAHHAQYLLTRAQLLHARGQPERGLKDVQTVLARNDDPEIAARAECLLGDLLAQGSNRDPKSALDHHQTAVQLATNLVSDARPAVSRSGKRILLDAYLGAANDIATGNFKNKKLVVPKWLEMSTELSEAIIANDPGDSAVLIRARRHLLAAYTAVGGSNGGESIGEALFESGRQLIAAAKDPLYRGYLEWELGEALLQAADYESQRGNRQPMLTYANNASALLEPLIETRPSSPHRDLVLGRLYYSIGSVYAIEKKDHREAISFYERATPYLTAANSVVEPDKIAAHGDRFVTMGVSYWETGDVDEAMTLTKEGVRLLDQAVKEGFVDSQILSVPYTNLAAMYEAKGDKDEARTLTARVQKMNGPAKGTRTR